MTIEKLNQLIDNAPEFAQWWEGNHANVQKKLKNNRRWIGVFNGAHLISIVPQFMGVLHGINILFPDPSAVLLTTGNALPLLCALAMIGGVFWFNIFMLFKLDMLACQWPKKLGIPLKNAIDPDELLDGCSGMMKTIDDTHKKQIVEKIINHSQNPVRAHAASLLRIKDLNMPDCWWVAVECVVDDIEGHEITVAPKTAQEQLEDVYLDIEKSTNLQHSKVLKL